MVFKKCDKCNGHGKLAQRSATPTQIKWRKLHEGHIVDQFGLPLPPYATSETIDCDKCEGKGALRF